MKLILIVLLAGVLLQTTFAKPLQSYYESDDSWDDDEDENFTSDPRLMYRFSMGSTNVEESESDFTDNDDYSSMIFPVRFNNKENVYKIENYEDEDEYDSSYGDSRINTLTGENSSNEFSEEESDEVKFATPSYGAESNSESEQSDHEEVDMEMHQHEKDAYNQDDNQNESQENENVGNGIEEGNNDIDDDQFTEIDYHSQKEELNPIASTSLDQNDEDSEEGSDEEESHHYTTIEHSEENDEDFDANAEEENNNFGKNRSDESGANLSSKTEGHQGEEEGVEQSSQLLNDKESLKDQVKGVEDNGDEQEDNESYEEEADEDLLDESSPENSASTSLIQPAKDDKIQDKQNTFNQEDDIKDSDLLEDDDDEDLLADDDHHTTTIQDSNLYSKDNASVKTTSTVNSSPQTIPTSIPAPIPLPQLALPGLPSLLKQTTSTASSSSQTHSSTTPNVFVQSDKNNTPERKFQPLLSFYTNPPDKMPLTGETPPLPPATSSAQASVSSNGTVDQKSFSSSPPSPPTVPSSNSSNSALKFTPSFLSRSRPSFPNWRGSGN